MRISDWSSDECSSYLLTIDHFKIPALQLLAQPVHCEFGCVACTREHRLAEEDAAQRDAVQPPDQLPVSPHFNAMGLTTIEQFHVGVAHVLAQPGAVATAALTTAGLQHRIECAIETECVVAPPDRFLEAVRDVELAWLKHGARIRTPPQHRLFRVVPGENALSVSADETRRRQIAAYREQPGRIARRQM